VAYRGHGVSRKVADTFASFCREAGLVGVSSHTIRHTVATALGADGYTAAQIAKQLGHTDGGKTASKVYDHSSASEGTAKTLDTKLRRAVK